MFNFYYRNPRLLVLTVCLILVAGLSSYMILPRMEDPILTQRVATINTVFPGANAERVEALVTDPIEQSIREIEEIKDIRSQSRAGVSLITINLADAITDVDEVWSQIRDKLDDAVAEFPVGALEPEFREIDMKAFAMILALAWEQQDAPNYAILRRHAETLKDRLLAHSGTQKVRLFGDPEEEFVATVDPAKLAALGLSAQDVALAIGSSDAKLAAGQLRGAQNQFQIEVSGELHSLDRISRTPIVVASSGQVVRLEDIATVSKGVVEPVSSLAIIDGRHAVTLGVLVRDDQRIDRWSQGIEETLNQYAKELPAGVALERVFQQNEYVESRLGSLLGNLLLGAAGVMVVIFLLMGWQSALVVGTALPLSSLMVLTGMRLMGIPIHQMSITGLIIAIGLLIDNAIVMVDEVQAELRAGESTGQAIAKTVRHLIVPLLGSTVTTALAFAPIALMTGPAGEFVGSIAISVIMAIFSSLFVSMTIVPALTGWLIHGDSASSWWRSGIRIDGLRKAYSHSLHFIFARPALGVALGMLLPIAGFVAATQLPEQFFPPADRDQCQIELELPAQSSIRETMAVTQRIREMCLDKEDVVSVDWFLGESAPVFYYNVVPRRENTANYAQALVQLKSFENAKAIINQLQLELDREFPTTRLLVRQLEQGPPFDAPVEIRVFGPNLETLREIGDEVRDRLARIENVLHTRSDLSESLSKLAVDVDEEQARLVGLTHATIANQLQTTLEGIQRGSVLEATEELPVRVRLTNQSRSDLAAIGSLDLISPVPSPTSAVRHIPLSAVADVKLVAASAAIPHRDTERMNEVQAYIRAGVLPATVLGAFSDTIEAQPIEVPPGYRIEFGGEAAERNDAVGNLLANVGVLVVLMVATLVMSFGSFRMSGIIGMVAGLSMGLGLLALWVFGYPFGFMAIIGSMGLMGVAINDAIVVLAGIRADETAKSGDRQAIHDVVMQTTRHIIATSLTTMAGFAPLVIAGGEFWPPMAIAISGGVAGATILALYFVPSMYLLLRCAHCKGRGAA